MNGGGSRREGTKSLSEIGCLSPRTIGTRGQLQVGLTWPIFLWKVFMLWSIQYRQGEYYAIALV